MRGMRASAIGPHRAALGLVLLFWLATPFLVASEPAQDGPAFAAAARIVDDDPDAIYAVRGEDTAAYERWRVAYCDADPTGTCAFDARFLSPPPALLVPYPWHGLGAAGALLASRLVQAVLFVVGMVLVRRTVAPAGEADERLLLLGAVLVTPVVVNVITLGQVTATVFLVAALGVTATTRRRDVGTGAVLAAATLLKLFPAFALGVAVTRRRWSLVVSTAAWTVAAVALSSALFPVGLWSDFLRAIDVYRDLALSHSYNRSFDSFLRATVVPDLESGALTAVTLAVRVVALGLVWFRWVRHAHEDVQWTWVLLAAVLLDDYSWPHYMVLLVPYAATLVRHERVPAWSVPLAGALGSLLVATWSSPVLGGLLFQLTLVGALAVAPVAARGRLSPRPAAARARR